jgi:hypothetical protein
MKIVKIQAFFSNVLMLFFPKPVANFLPGILRVSFSIANKQDEIVRFVRILREISCISVTPNSKFFARFYYGTPVLPVTAEEKMIKAFTEKIMEDVYSFKSIN